MSGDIAVSVLIPAWDEEQSIGAVVVDSLAAYREAGLTVECLVCVDSRTVDRTSRAARDAGARTIAQHGVGLTAAVLEMAEVAAGQVCAVLDGDGQHDAYSLPKLTGPVLAGAFDVVTGARDPGSLGSGFGRGWRGVVRRAGALALRFAARLALRRTVPDPLTGMFACRRSDLRRLQQKGRVAPPRGYKLGLGLMAMTAPGRVAHVTVPFLPRQGGESKLTSAVVWTTLRQLLGVGLSRRSTASDGAVQPGEM